MAEFSLGANLTKMSPEELSNQVAKMIKTLNWLLRNLDSLNVTEINTNLTTVSSEDGETVINGPVLEMYDKQSPAVLRLKEGYDSVTGDFLFELYNKVGAKTVGLDSNGNLNLSTSGTNNARMVITADSLACYNSSNQKMGMYFDITDTGISDIIFYHNGSALMEFYDDVTSYIIRGSLGATGLSIGGNSVPINPVGNWEFAAATVNNLNLASGAEFEGQSISKGATDSGGTGYAVLRVPN